MKRSIVLVCLVSGALAGGMLWARQGSDRKADFDGSGRVDFWDILVFASAFGASSGDSGWDARLDLDGDGSIGYGDFRELASQFGRRYLSITGEGTYDLGGGVQLQVGSNVLVNPLEVSVQVGADPSQAKAERPDFEAVGRFLAIEAGASRLARPVALVFSYATSALPVSAAGQELTVALWDGTSWQEMTAQVDTVSQTVRVATSRPTGVWTLRIRSEIPEDLSGFNLVFGSNREGHFELFAMNGDGSGIAQLTGDDGFNAKPAWSPDGKKIAFMTDRDGNKEIYVVNADGTEPVNLTRDLATDSDPSWSPDGWWIAFWSDRTGNQEIFAFDADGTNPVNLSRNPGRDAEPCWSPGGTLLAFVSDRDGNEEIYTMNSDGVNPKRLTETQTADISPCISPDVRRIAFVSERNVNREIYVMYIDGTEPINISRHWRDDVDPAWLPW